MPLNLSYDLERYHFIYFVIAWYCTQVDGRWEGGCWPRKLRPLEGVIKPEETWADKGRYQVPPHKIVKQRRCIYGNKLEQTLMQMYSKKKKYALCNENENKNQKTLVHQRLF